MIPLFLAIKIYLRMKKAKSVAKYSFLIGDYVDDNYYCKI